MSHKTVLFVDDEELILKTIQRIVQGKDFKSVFASSGDEALNILQEQDVHIIITDMRMPGMSGLDLLAKVKVKYPQIIRIILSGYTDVNTLLAAINEERIFRYITKPWETQDDLLSVIEEAFERVDRIAAAPTVGTAVSETGD